MPMEKQRHSFTTANWDCVSHLAATVDPPGKDALLLLGECGTAGSPLASTDITLTWGEECLPLTWPPLTPWAWGGVGLLALGREEISGFPLHPHWFHPRGEGGTASPGWTFRLTTLPLLSGAGGGGVQSQFCPWCLAALRTEVIVWKFSMFLGFPFSYPLAWENRVFLGLFFFFGLHPLVFPAHS